MRIAVAFVLGILFSIGVYPATKVWDGGGSDANWQTAANWADDIAPVAGDDLVFAANAPQQANNNNFFFLTSFRSITVEGGAYSLGGNPIRLTDGLNVNGGTHMFNIALTLNGSQTFIADNGGTATILVLSVGSSALTIDGAGIVGIGLISGSGNVTKNGLGVGAIIAATGFSGGITLNEGIFVVDASIAASPVDIQTAAPTGTLTLSGLGGTGTVGHVNVTQGVISAGTLTSPTGILNISNGITFTPNGAYVCKIGGTTAGSDGHDQLNVTGNVSLNNAILAPIPWNGFEPAIGDEFVILRNDGSDPIDGTFLNLPDGGVFSGPLNTAYAISYQGGDGNDISIKRVRRSAFDFDGDGRSDVSVYRPDPGIWYTRLSGTEDFSVDHFGVATDEIAPADYDGDNKTDIAVFRPSDGTWYTLCSSDMTFSHTQFGQAGDVPVPNDYDGDGRADIAVFRPADGVWYRLGSLTGQFAATQFGQNGDQPLVGDFDGDGLGDLAVFRAGIWYQNLSADNSVRTTHFGLLGDLPVPADYDGDGTTDVAVYRDGIWYLDRSTEGFFAFNFGLPTDVPVAADYDGDGRSDVAVYREGIWYQQGSSSGFTSVGWGISTDRPIPAAFQ